MKKKIVQLRFREVDRGIFEDVLKSEKKIETRAATKKFLNIKPGDTIRCVCGKDRLEKRVKK
jgi:ASC-1-like (ASCH) protein